MIKSIKLQGFKSFVLNTLDLGNLTLLTGLNSSGKSSVIQAILLLEKATRSQELLLEGHGSLAECQNRYTKDGIMIKGIFENGSEIEINNHITISKGDIDFPEVIYISADRFGPETSVPIHLENDRLGKRGENIFKCIEVHAEE